MDDALADFNALLPDQKEPEIVLPEPKKAKRLFKSTLYFSNLSNTPKQIYNIGLKFRNELFDSGYHQRWMVQSKLASNRTLFCKAFYFLWLTGSRVGEVLKEPSPKIKLGQLKVGEQMIDVMFVEKLNQKHKDKNGKTALMQQQIPFTNEYEKMMWDYIIGRERTEIMSYEYVLDFSPFGGYKSNVIFNEYMVDHFRTNLTDGDVMFRDEGIRPHLLRHMRAYNMLVEQGWDVYLVMSLMGWKKREMVEHYAYINRVINAQQQLEMLKRELTGKLPAQLPQYGRALPPLYKA